MKLNFSSYTHKIKNLFRLRQGMVTTIPYVWLIFFMLIPFLIVIKISLSHQEIAIPPYSPLLHYDKELSKVDIYLYFSNYQEIFENLGSTLMSQLNPFNAIIEVLNAPKLENIFSQLNLLSEPGKNIFVKTYLSSIYYATLTTLLCLIIGFPMAYGISKFDEKYRNVFLLVIMLPFWTSFLLRVYAWIGLLSRNGIINNFLAHLGLEPLNLLYNEFSLLLVMIYTYLPFMVLPIYTQIIKIDTRLIEAAKDLGAGPIKAFWKITWPLTFIGVITGSMLVFIPAVGEFVVPQLVAGSDNLMIGKVLWQAFFDQNNWPLASALAVIMVMILLLPITIYHRYNNKLEKQNKND